MLTPWKTVSTCLTSGKKKNKQILNVAVMKVTTLVPAFSFFNVMSGKASVTLIGGHSVISLSTKPLSEPLHASSSYLGPSHHRFGLKSDAT